MSKLAKAQHSQGHSKHFFEYIRAIGECKSKQEEDIIVSKDIALLKYTMADSKTDKKLLKENVVRMFYGEMLGHPAEFGHIHAVNLASHTDLLFKRTGYLATWLSVNPEHEFMYLIVASLQRDMKSASFLEIAVALTAAAKLTKPELMPALNPEIVALMSHTQALVRKKVVVVMHSFWRKSDGAVGDEKNYRTLLCDRDPGVMGATLNIFYDLALSDPASQRDLLPSFLSILKQVMEHRLSREYDYHRVPAPWVQIRLLKLIAIIAANDEVASHKCTEVLIEVLKRADTGLNIGHAVVYECITTITSLFPVPEMIEAAADHIAKFLTSPNSNIKYLGITALSRIVKINPKYAREHQSVVIECLEDSDDTIRRKTLSLLFAMCNEDNVEAIVLRLLKFLASSTDGFLREELVRNICNVAEQFSNSNEWYVETLNRVLELAAEHVTATTLQGMLKLIAEGDGEDEAEDAQFRTKCVEDYFQMMENPDKVVPNALLQVAAWVIGEYGFLSQKLSRAMLLDRLSDMLDRTRDSATRGWIITGIMKLVAHNPTVPDNIEEVIQRLLNSRSVSLQQRCYEFFSLMQMMPVLKKVLPLDGCCEEIEVDEGLSFLDGIVEEALANGAQPYQKKEIKTASDDTGLKTEAYKSAQVDVVDEDDLVKGKFNAEEPDKLIVKDRKWGAQNLAEEAAVEKPMDAGSFVDDGDAAGHAEGAHSHVDPVADDPRKPTKNEKFINDIFGGGGAKKSRKKIGTKGARAAEAAKRAAEAEAATAGLTTETYRARQAGDDDEDVGPAAGSGAAGPALTPHKVEINIQRQQAPDSLMFRVGALSTSGPIERVVFQFTPPPKCLMQLKPAVDGAGVVDGNMIRFERGEHGQPIFAMVRLGAEDYPQGGRLQVNVSFSTAAGPGSVQGVSQLTVADLVRPVQLETAAFGKQWVTLAANEAKVRMSFQGELTPDRLGKHLLERVGVRIIQVIGKEAIAVGQVVPCGRPLFVHMTVDGSSVNASVRSLDKNFSGAAAQSLATN